MITVILIISLLFVLLLLCIWKTFQVPKTMVDFESEAVKMKIKEIIQDFGKVPVASGNIQALKNIGDISSSLNEQTQTYQVNVSVSSHAVVKSHSTFNIHIGELDLLTSITSNVQEVVDVAITFKPSGKLQSFFDALHNFRIQAKAFISFGQIAANVASAYSFVCFFFLSLFVKINSSCNIGCF